MTIRFAFILAILTFLHVLVSVQAQAPVKDRPLKIVKKPLAAGSSVANCSKSSGKVVLKVVFDKNGTISQVDVVKASHCSSFNEGAINAARKIMFEPEITNGEPVTIEKNLQYGYFW